MDYIYALHAISRMNGNVVVFYYIDSIYAYGHVNHSLLAERRHMLRSTVDVYCSCFGALLKDKYHTIIHRCHTNQASQSMPWAQ